MAEFVLKNVLKKREVKGIKVSSAGISAINGDKINEKAATALKKRGITVRKFSSAKITAETVKSQNAVVCMTSEQKHFFRGFGNVYCVSELTGFGDIPDPFGKSQEVYDKTLDVIILSCEKIAELLISENERINFEKEQKRKLKAEKQALKNNKNLND